MTTVQTPLPIKSEEGEKITEPSKVWRCKWICLETGIKIDGRWYNENDIWWSPKPYDTEEEAVREALDAYRKFPDRYPWDFLGAFETE